MDPPVDDSLLHWLLGAWSAALSLLMLLIGFIWRQLVEDVRNKVDRSEVDQLRQDMNNNNVQVRTDLENWRRTQEAEHRENRSRLDRILENQAARLLDDRRRRGEG
jgi:hypothetical protein